MKQLYLKSIFLAILSLINNTASAEQVDGIYYNLDKTSKTAIVVSGSPKYSGAISIPPTITYDGTTYSVTSIGAGAFKECYDLTSIIIPNSVTSIYYQAFYGCGNLSSVTIEDGKETLSFEYYFSNVSGNYKYISDYFIDCPIKTLYLGRNINYSTSTYSLQHPFANKSSLTTVTIGNSVTSIREEAFGNCSNLTSLTIGNSVVNIGYGAFKGCSGLTSVTIPNNVASIGQNAFQGCNLKEVEFHVNTIESWFSDFQSIQKIAISKEVTNIGDYAFSGCGGLTTIEIPNSVTSIGSGAFYGCSSLTTPIAIPNSMTSLGESTFYGCSSLSSVTIGNNVASIGNNAFFGCSALTSINIPNRVTNIGNSAFYGCSCLTSIDIPNRVTSIGNSAFQNCSDLTSLSIPISVTNIGNSAFYGCTNLESVYSEITDVFSIDAFGNGSENATLYVPYGKKLTYIQTPGWNVFNDIIEMDPALMNTSLLLSCNSKGSITINGTTVFTNKIGSVDILEDAENTIVFTPKANCKLEQVCFNGFDVTTSVENNTLKAVIPAKSQMVVTFAKESGDMNNDGIINISDVVLLVNMILGQ